MLNNNIIILNRDIIRSEFISQLKRDVDYDSWIRLDSEIRDELDMLDDEIEYELCDCV